jgi:hypothetical protein
MPVNDNTRINFTFKLLRINVVYDLLNNILLFSNFTKK